MKKKRLHIQALKISSADAESRLRECASGKAEVEIKKEIDDIQDKLRQTTEKLDEMIKKRDRIQELTELSASAEKRLKVCEDGLKTAKETFIKAAKYFGETEAEIQTNEKQDPGRFMLPIVEFLRLLKLAGGVDDSLRRPSGARVLVALCDFPRLIQ